MTEKIARLKMHSRFSGQFIVEAEPWFDYEFCREHLSFANVVRDPYRYREFTEALTEAGYDVLADHAVLDEIEKIDERLEKMDIENLSITKKDGTEGELFDYQNLLLQIALNNGADYFFFNAGTGTGKTMMTVAGAQELFNRDEIDLALVFTLKNVKPDFTKAFTNNSALHAVMVEGEKKTRRRKYEKGDFHAIVMNYEKARKNVDFDELLSLVRGKRVLFAFDEVQKILNNNTAREGVDALISASDRSIVWPLSASIVDGDPARYWKIFEWAPKNPLGTFEEFADDYVSDVNYVTRKVRLKNGYMHKQVETVYQYDTTKLLEVKHRVGDLSRTVRKSDPGVREFFKGLEFRGVPLEMSKDDRELYTLLQEASQEKSEEGKLLEYYNALRWTCLTAESHLYSSASLSTQIAAELPSLSSKTSAKMDRLMEDISVLRDGGDRCVVFTHWTDLSLKIIARELRKNKIPHVLHYGGQTQSANDAARDMFKRNSDITVFLSSDAGSHGLNLQEARVVINYECPYSYDILMQRNDRIDRADSYLDGLEAWAYYYENTLEEYIFKMNEQRRITSSAVQGTTELLSRFDSEPGQEEIRKLLRYGI